MKKCVKCKIDKDESEFYKNKSMDDGISHYCKKCAREINRKWHKENKEKKNEKNRKWRKENKEKSSESSRKWQKENKEKASEKSRKWRKENKEKVSETSRKWKKENRDNLGDVYIKIVLGITNPPQELIEMKREQLKIHRLIKEVQNVQNN